MNNYIFILGRNPKLSLLELLSYFKARDISYNLKEYSKIAVIFSLPELNFNRLIKNLGGTIKIGLITKSLYTGTKNKIKYAISYYSKTNKDIKSEIKSQLKKEKIKAFYKPPKLGKILSPSEVIKKQIDLEIIYCNGQIAKTIACFNPLEVEKRDIERPKKDYLKTTSIRLAKILINLSQVKESQILLDPFCGYSTILQEALLMGINVIGLDKDELSIISSETNLKFIKEKYNLTSTYQLMQSETRNLSNYIKSVDAVATEPYLGPYIKKGLNLNQIQKIKNELELLYTETLKELRKITKGKIAIIFPFFLTKKKKIRLDLEKIFKITGFKISNDFKEVKLPVKLPKGKIQREIYVLE